LFCCHLHITFRIALVTVVLSIFRMQKLAQEQNDKIEKVNRERKYHQVNMTFLSTLVTVIFLKFLLSLLKVTFFNNYCQQNTAYELNALSMQWNELCQKNIDIKVACASAETHLNELRREAAER